MKIEKNNKEELHTKALTGYPTIDKPWLKYYSREAINAPLPKMTLYQYAWENNKNNLSDIAFHYFGTKISYREFFENIKKAAREYSGLKRPGCRGSGTIVPQQ